MKSTSVLHLTYKQLPPEAAELFFIFTLGAGVDEKTIREDMIFLDSPRERSHSQDSPAKEAASETEP
jgi:hypothetical protein